MGNLDEILEPDVIHGRERFGVPALVLAPAVLRIVIVGQGDRHRVGRAW